MSFDLGQILALIYLVVSTHNYFINEGLGRAEMERSTIDKSKQLDMKLKFRISFFDISSLVGYLFFSTSFSKVFSVCFSPQ